MYSVPTNLITSRIQRQLQSLDWDFPEYLPGSSKAIHWYPGTFPAELPATLIQALTKPEDIVMDPYGGVGTTALEAIRLGRKAWLVEFNPIAVLASYVSGCLLILKSINDHYPKVVLSLIKEKLDKEFSNVENSRLVHDEKFEQTCDELLSTLVAPSPKELLSFYMQSKPQWDLLSEWVEASTLDDLRRIYESIISSSDSSFVKLLSMTMLSGALRPLSSQIKSWGHIADNVRPKDFEKKNVMMGCSRWISRTGSIVERTEVAPLSLDKDHQIRYWISLYNWSDKNPPNVIPSEKVTTLITSPPYAGAIDYIFAQRLSLYLLGFDDIEIATMSGKEFGARRQRSKTISKTKWAEDLVNALAKQIDYLDDEAFISLVLPHKESGRDIGAVSLESFLMDRKWSKAFEIDRSIRQLRTRQSWTSIKKETIQIYGI